MPRSSSNLLEWLRGFWRSLGPGFDDADPSVRVLDEWRTEFNWRGPPLTFDRRLKMVLRGGRVLVKSADITSVDIEHIHWDDERPEYWKVSLGTGAFFGVAIGTTRNDVEASIAAARVATVAGVKVRSL
jgi:hypothetical protein